MFGFLRRKKPAESPPAPAEPAPGPGDAGATPDAAPPGEVDERALEDGLADRVTQPLSIRVGDIEATLDPTQAGLAVGDVILMLDQQAVDNLSGFNRILESLEAGRTVSLLIQRGEGRMFFPLRIPKS